MQWKASSSLNRQDMHCNELNILQSIPKWILQCILEQALYPIYTTIYIYIYIACSFQYIVKTPEHANILLAKFTFAGKQCLQNQPSRGLKKRCSENMQQIYRRTPMLTCDFNKVPKQIALRHGCSPVNLLHNFRIPSPRNTYGWLLLYFSKPHLDFA